MTPSPVFDAFDDSRRGSSPVATSGIRPRQTNRARTLAMLVAATLIVPGQVAATIATPSSTVAASDTSIQYFGRWDRVTNPLAPRTGWPGTGLVARFTGTSIRGSFIEDNGNDRLAVSVDGLPAATVRLARGSSTVVLAQGLVGANHTIRLVKRTEGCCGAANFSFTGFTLDPGASLLPPPTAPTHQLEFYGDSHAAGYSAESTSDSGDTAYKNADHSYPALTASLLGAAYTDQAWSGIGVVKGNVKQTMPQVFDRILQTSASPRWNFASYQPDVVVVQLGDNDVYSGATQAQITAALERFVTTNLRPVYPNAHIVLGATSGWAYDEVADYIDQVAADLVQAGDPNVSWVTLPWLSGQEHRVYCEQAAHAQIVADHIAAWFTSHGVPGWSAARSQVACLARRGGVANPGFEDDTLPDTQADGWRAFATASSTSIVVTSSSLPAGFGSRYIEASAKRTGFAGVYQASEAVPGFRYTAGAFLRLAPGATGTGRIRLEFRDQAQNLISGVTTLPTLTATWMPYTLTGVAPAGTWQVRISLISDTGTKVDFDNVTLAETAPGP